jgi:TonB family protein
MSHDPGRSTLFEIPLVQEKYGRSVLVSMGIHGIVVLLIIFGGYLLPSPTIQLGGGRGGGMRGDVSTVGIVDELSGGIGMVKPSLVPKPPALLDEPRKDVKEAIPLPRTVEPKKKRVSAKEISKAKKAISESNVIPTAPEPGSGGVAGHSAGIGGGVGGGIGVSIGSGSGGFGDSYYPRTVEARISSNWIRPPEGVRVEMVYSFYIAANGSIYGIKMEKSSGNPQMDLTALRAINASNPLTPPPAEFRGRPIQFVAQFIYPPNP